MDAAHLLGLRLSRAAAELAGIDRVRLRVAGWFDLQLRLVEAFRDMLLRVARPVRQAAVVHRVRTALGQRNHVIDHRGQRLVFAGSPRGHAQLLRNRLTAEVANPLIAFKDFVCDYKVGGYTPPLGP
jgi:hypothetical protein